jgi:enterochelin esterase-like enzyme
MRRLLDQMSAEAAVLGPPAPPDAPAEGAVAVAVEEAPAATRPRRRRPAGSSGTGVVMVTPVVQAAPVAPPRAEAAPAPEAAAPAATTSRRWARRWMLPWISGLAVVVLSVVVWRLAGTGLQGWVVGLGMDDERAALMGTLLVAAGAVAAVVAAGGAGRAARLGGVVAMVVIEIVPFLIRGSHTVTTEGLTAHVRLRGWVLQPLGMLLLAVIVVSIGAALGQLLRSDVSGLIRTLRRNPGRWGGLGAFLIFAGVAAGPAITAVQDGPISALYDYASAGTGHGTGGPALAAGGAIIPGVTEPRTGAADSLPGRQRPGHIQTLTVDGRRVLVYLPGDYTVEQARDFPVIYFLHGYPGNEDNWVGEGAQLPEVLDQLISSGELPPSIAVMPNGNGQALSDAEWGNSQRGDRIEDWLVNRVVPEVDHRFRTLGTAFRGAGGLSSGGFGAINLALRHPDTFRWAASYSGYFGARRDIFGPAAAANSPMLVAAQLPPVERMPLFLGAGDVDREFLGQQNTFARVLRGLGWQPVHEDVVSGGHGWEAWRLEMVHSLQWLGGLWGSDPGTPSCRASCNG